MEIVRKTLNKAKNIGMKMRMFSIRMNTAPLAPSAATQATDVVTNTPLNKEDTDIIMTDTASQYTAKHTAGITTDTKPIHNH